MKIESYFKHFLLIPVSHIPIIGEDGNLIGLLSREKISREMADLDSVGIEYESIPEHLIELENTDGILYYFQNNRKISILNQFAERVDSWEKPRFLAEFSSFQERKKKESDTPPQKETPTVPIETPESKNKSLIYKLMELILKNFGDALFATDKDGNTTFYNQRFEEDILTKPLFKDSIAIAEKYFRELNRDLISEYFKTKEKEDPGSFDHPSALKIYVVNLGMTVKMVTLKSDEKIFGFLYQFVEKEEEKIEDNDLFPFPVLKESFDRGVNLNDIMKEVESAYIYKSFKKNLENMSHTASDLGIPRSTLQNRIKYLGLNEALVRDPGNKIPRIRKTKDSDEEKDFDLDEELPEEFIEEDETDELEEEIVPESPAPKKSSPKKKPSSKKKPKRRVVESSPKAKKKASTVEKKLSKQIGKKKSNPKVIS